VRSDRYVHPEFGRLAPRSHWRRELRVRFVSMLLGIGVAAAAAAALAWAHRHGESGSASPLANREAAATFSPPNAQAEAIDRERGEQVGINTDRARTVEAARRVEVGTACDADAGCGSDAHSAGKPHASGLRAANERPPIAGVLVGRGDPPGGTHAAASWADVPAGTMPASSPKPAPGHPTAARSQQNSAAADQPSTNRMPHQRPKIARTQNAARKEVSSNHRSGDERGSGRDNDNRPGQLGHAYARDGSAGPAGFWAWSW